MNASFKTSLQQHALFIGLFILIAFLYSYPVFQGNQLAAGDSVQWRAMSQEARTWSDSTGENPLWTNAMFGGMPTYTFYTRGKANFLLEYQFKLVDALRAPVYFLLLPMIGFFVLLRSWKTKTAVAAIGAIAYAFASYNLQIIAAGHNTKMLCLGYMPLALAGMHWIYNKRYLLGAGVALFALTMMVANMMYQIDYYAGIIMFFFAIGYFIQALRNQTLKQFFLSSALMLGIGLLSLGPSLNLFMVNKEYAKFTMRGGQSEITLGKQEKKTKGGLDKEYAFRWSQGIGETFTLLVPNLYGGGNQTKLGNNSNTYETLISLGAGEENAENFSSHADTYWGPQPFLSGPFYFGIIVILLAVCGLFLIRSPFKWVIVAVSVLAIMMSWGRHFSALNYFLFDTLPYFNNFRTPSMIMTIAGAMFCLLAFLGLQECLDENRPVAERWAAIKKSIFLVGGLTLILGIGGSAFLSFRAADDDQTKARLAQQLGNEQAGNQLFEAILKDRPAIARKDALRSVAFLLLATGLLWLLLNKRLKQNHALLGIGVLVAVDLIGIATRYLNEENYVSTDAFEAQFNPRPVDLELQKDPDPYFRVYDITRDPYNEAMQAYYNKCVGGYHPAKLETYQDLIDHQLSGGKMNAEVLNMLNTKYIIFNGNNQQASLQPNPQACGNAWFVNQVKLVDNADQEMLAMNAPDFSAPDTSGNSWKAKQTAIVQKKHWKGNQTQFMNDSIASVRLTKYGLNELRFESNNSQPGFAVFSDIYYPAGWTARVDGKEMEITKTNYLLRGLNLPAGKHDIVFTFRPETYFKWYHVSLYSSILMLLIFLTGIGTDLRKALRTSGSEDAN